jgi:hypothetical protein
MATLQELKRIAPNQLGGEAESARNAEELLDAVIAHANGDLKQRMVIKSWKAFRAQEGNDALLAVPTEDDNGNPDWRVIDRPEASQLATDWNRRDRELLSDIRGACIEQLEAAIQGQKTFWAFLTSPRGRRFLTPNAVVSRPKARWVDGRITVDWEISATSPAPTAAASLTALALSTLAARTDGDALPISRCTLESCGRFFVIRKQRGEKGRTRTKYCSTDHMHLAHEENSGARVRLSRERKRLAKQKTRRMPK